MVKAAKTKEVDAIVAYPGQVVEIQALMGVAKHTGMRIHPVFSGQRNLDATDGRAAMLTIATRISPRPNEPERIYRAKPQPG